MSNTSVVPFGKYRGQPVEVLGQDKEYADWLMAQPWFRERHQPIYNLIINHFGEPSETPEHNALQALFLDTPFRFAFIEAARPGWLHAQKATIRDCIIANGKEAITAAESYRRRNVQDKALANDQTALLLAEWLGKSPCRATTSVTFETKGIDVVVGCVVEPVLPGRLEYLKPETYGTECHVYAGMTVEHRFTVEIKPSLADEYPAVLRQMRAADSGYLFVDRYIGTGATPDQVREIFRAAGRRIVTRAEVATAADVIARTLRLAGAAA